MRVKAFRFSGFMALLIFLPGCLAGLGDSTQKSAHHLLSPGDHEMSLRVNAFARHYVVHVPPGAEQLGAIPVVVMLHGGGGKAKFAARETGWREKADQEGFLAVFPEALPPKPDRRSSFAFNPQLWNDGSDRFYDGQAVVDDVAFLSAMLDQLVDRFNVDPGRIYFTGFSNGASMSFLLAAKLSKRLAAIAPIAGASWVTPTAEISGVSVLYITGTEDPLNPLDGGDLELANGGQDIVRSKPKPPVRDSIEQWVSALNCQSEPEVNSTPEGVITERFSSCRDDNEVRYVRIEGLGHHWPGGRKMLPESMVGKWSDRVNATDLVWEFFSHHKKD